MIKIIYRISDAGYNKIKPHYINNENCLFNATKVFEKAHWLVIADNTSNKTNQMIEKYVANQDVQHVSIGHGAGTFNLALDEALKLEDTDEVYFIENDYLHKTNAAEALKDGFNVGADYVSLYDHPDKYINKDKGGNPFVEGGGEVTQVFLGNVSHWKLTNSTAMSFAAAVKTLKNDEEILRKYTKGSYPQDFKMFIELREKGKSLITPIPSYSTHGETQWLAPLIDWNNV